MRYDITKTGKRQTPPPFKSFWPGEIPLNTISSIGWPESSHRHNLVMKRVNSCYINPYSNDSILLMSLNLHGIKGEAAWDACNLQDFLRELVTVKYFASFDSIDHFLVSKGVINGTMGNLLRAMVNFIHQALVNIDVNLYTQENITEGLCRHPELPQNCATPSGVNSIHMARTSKNTYKSGRNF